MRPRNALGRRQLGSELWRAASVRSQPNEHRRCNHRCRNVPCHRLGRQASEARRIDPASHRPLSANERTPTAVTSRTPGGGENEA